MKNLPVTNGRNLPILPMSYDRYKHIRPAGVGSGASITTATAHPSVSGSNPTDYQDFIGAKFPISRALPQRGVDAIPIGVSITPESVSSSTHQAATDRVCKGSGGCHLWMSFWKDDQAFSLEVDLGYLFQSGTSRYVAYNYEYGDMEYYMDGFVLGQMATPPWDPPYTVNQVSLRMRVHRSSNNIALKVGFYWVG